jgi:hypothetical protein
LNNFLKGLLKGLASLPELIKLLLASAAQILPFLRALALAFRRCFHRPARGGCCFKLPNVYKRPDPMIYSQYWLMSQGLAVTWDNPDIQLFDMAGNPASPADLVPDRDYRVEVTCWNNSYDAGAPFLAVHLSYLSFGAGTTSTLVPPPVVVSLGVKGSSTCPATASFVWRTPATPGHYCLQALLVCGDDANSKNNLGQKNVHVGKMSSPAVFTFPIENQTAVARHVVLAADMYRLPALASCAAEPPAPRSGGRLAESRARWARALREQAYGMFPVDPAWHVTVSPSELDIEARASRTVTVSVEHRAGSFAGTMPFNVHAFATGAGNERALLGGVTLYVQGS